MAIKLTIEALDQAHDPLIHELDQSLITVGRSKSCHIELDHPGISRRHFIIKYLEGNYVILDEKSRHGTLLDTKKLVPQEAYSLGHAHVVEVPGFRISLNCDGNKPHLERTTVVARQLLDDLLQNEIRPQKFPTLRSADGLYYFKIQEEKTNYILGSQAPADFVLPHEAVAEKHFSLTRDIFGISLLPFEGQQVILDGKPVSTPQILRAGSIISVGNIDLIFHDATASENSEIKREASPPLSHEVPTPMQAKDEEEPAPRQDAPKKNAPAFRLMDGIFIGGFLAVLAGAIVAFVMVS